MRVLNIVFSTLLVLFGIFLVGGFLIPSEWVVSRSILIHATATQIYPYVSDFKAWEKWSPWNSSTDASLKYTYEGSEMGVGAKQLRISEKMGRGWMELTAADPQKGVAYDFFIDMGRSQSSLHGQIEFTPEQDGTKIIWTDRGHSDSSLQRWMSVVIRPMLGKDINKGLATLKDVVENATNEALASNI